MKHSHLQQMRPEFGNGSSFYVAQILHQLDHLLHTAPVIEDPPLDVVEVQLKLDLVRAMQGDCHALPLVQRDLVSLAERRNTVLQVVVFIMLNPKSIYQDKKSPI